MSKQNEISASLEEYLKRKARENSKLSYSDYRLGSDTSHEGKYHSALTRALTDRALKSPGVGASGERISRMGLSRGGYEEYLAKSGAERTEKSIRKARGDYLTAEEKIGTGYRSYLKEYEARQSSLEKSVTDKLIKNEVADYDTAYRYALMAGLSPDTAEGIGKTVSNTVSEAVRKRVYDKVMGQVITLRLDPESAGIYAKSLGLNDEDVNQIVEHAKSFEENNYEISQEYLDYLEQIGAITTGHGVHVSGNHSN